MLTDLQQAQHRGDFVGSQAGEVRALLHSVLSYDLRSASENAWIVRTRTTLPSSPQRRPKARIATPRRVSSRRLPRRRRSLRRRTHSFYPLYNLRLMLCISVQTDPPKVSGTSGRGTPVGKPPKAGGAARTADVPSAKGKRSSTKTPSKVAPADVIELYV